MTDVRTEMSPDVAVQPDAAAELAAVPAQADDSLRYGTANLEAPAAERVLPEVEYAIGSTRQAVLDHFTDLEPGAEQSMSQIKAALSHVAPGTIEAAVRRECKQERLERVGPGVYRLAPVKPPETKPAPLPEQSERSDDDWLSLMDAWFADRTAWDTEALGPRPNESGNRIPPHVRVRFTDKMRKRQERRKQAGEAAAKRAAADVELRDQLIAACHGNFMPGPALDDVSPIKAAIEFGVPIEKILWAIRCKVDQRMYPKNEPASSWRSEVLLREIAENYFRMLVPNLVAAWSAAGRAPAKPTDASEATAAVPVPPAPESAPEASPPQSEAVPGEGPGSEAAALLRRYGRPDVQATLTEVGAGARKPPDDARPVVSGRDHVLAAFNRSGRP